MLGSACIHHGPPLSELPGWRDPLTGDREADLALLEGLLTRTDKLTAGEDARRTYAVSVARELAVLSWARYNDDDRSGVASGAFRAAQRIAGAVEADDADAAWTNARAARALVLPGAPPAPAGRTQGVLGHPPSPPSAVDSITRLVDVFHADPWFACAADEVARLEVRLLWAESEYRWASQVGLAASSPQLDVARALAAEAARRLEACAPVPEPEPEPAPEPEPEPEPVTASVPAAVHFGEGTASIAPATARLLDQVAAALLRDGDARVVLRPRIEAVGDRVENTRLAEVRGRAVRRYLLRAGLAADQVEQTRPEPTPPLASAEGRGRRSQWPELDRARARRVDLAYVGTDYLILVPVDEEEDLQIGAPTSPPAR